MIFLDESGKRWIKIKRSTGILSSAVVIPVGILIAASVIYSPDWGHIALPKPFHTAKAVVVTTLSAVPDQPTAHENKKNNPTTATGSSQTAVVSQPLDTNKAQANTIIDLSPTASTPPNGAAQSTTTPTQTPPSPINQPTQSGNSAYGQSHKPTRS